MLVQGELRRGGRSELPRLRGNWRDSAEWEGQRTFRSLTSRVALRIIQGSFMAAASGSCGGRAG